MDDLDLRERMKQLARRVDGAAAPDLVQVRERTTRRRTRSALVVGLCIAIIGTLLAFSVLRTDGPTPAKEPDRSEGALAVWPQGNDGAEWRTDPEQVLERFGQQILGWSQPDIVRYEAGTYEMRPVACPPNARCTPSLTLTVEETTAGVWSITSVSHPDLEIEVGLMDPRAALAGGSTVRFDLTVFEGRSAHVGSVGSNGCREATAFEVGLGSGPYDLQLPEATEDDPNCDGLGAGYLFAYATDDTTVPVGDPLLEAAAIEYPWLTVVPLYLVMENEGETATATPSATRDVLGVFCYGDVRTQVTPRVVAQPDGVHVLVRGPDTYVEVQIDDDFRRIEDAPRELILPLEPGTHTVECILPGARQVPDPQPFEVIDPDGHWIDPFGSCEVSGIANFERVTVAEEDLATAASTHFGAVPGGAVAEGAGYAASPVERFFVVYHGDPSPVGVVGFESHPQGMWTSSSLVFCRS